MNVDKCAGVERVKNNNVKPTDKPDISCFVFLVIFPMDLLEKGLAAKNFAMLGLGDIVIPGLSILKTLLPAGVFFSKIKYWPTGILAHMVIYLGWLEPPTLLFII